VRGADGPDNIAKITTGNPGRSNKFVCNFVVKKEVLVFPIFSVLQQYCGSGFIESGSGYRSGFSISSESRFGSNPDPGFGDQKCKKEKNTA
jgi:hypothetical protein